MNQRPFITDSSLSLSLMVVCNSRVVTLNSPSSKISISQLETGSLSSFFDNSEVTPFLTSKVYNHHHHWWVIWMHNIKQNTFITNCEFSIASGSFITQNNADLNDHHHWIIIIIIRIINWWWPSSPRFRFIRDHLQFKYDRY